MTNETPSARSPNSTAVLMRLFPIRRRRLRLATGASAILPEGLKVFAWNILSPDMFQSDAEDTRLGFRFSLN
jgi:hypothetical protein